MFSKTSSRKDSSAPAAGKSQKGESLKARRGFMKSLAGIGAAAAIPATGLLAQSTGTSAGMSAEAATHTTPGRIDVHHHLYPPFYVKAMEADLKAQGFAMRP